MTTSLLFNIIFFFSLCLSFASYLSTSIMLPSHAEKKASERTRREEFFFFFFSLHKMFCCLLLESYTVCERANNTERAEMKKEFICIIRELHFLYSLSLFHRYTIRYRNHDKLMQKRGIKRFSSPLFLLSRALSRSFCDFWLKNISGQGWKMRNFLVRLKIF